MDYRTKFLGDYSFTVEQTTWIESGQITVTTYSYDGSVEAGSKNNTIVFYFGYSIEGTLYEDGTLANSYTNFENIISGEFESTKKNKFNCRFRGALGSGSSYSVTGNRK